MKQHLPFLWLQRSLCRFRRYNSNIWRYIFKVYSHLLTHHFQLASPLFFYISGRLYTNHHCWEYSSTSKPNSCGTISTGSWHKPSAAIWLSTPLMVSANPHHRCSPGQTTLRWCLGMACGKGSPGTTSSTIYRLGFCRDESLAVWMQSMSHALMVSKGPPTLFIYLSKDSLKDYSTSQHLQ